MIKRRKKREEEGRDSAFRLRGALVNDSKIIRYEKKTKIGDEHEIAVAGTYYSITAHYYSTTFIGK